jgi:hypothetical protein
MGQHAIDGRTQTGDPGAGGGDAGVVALVIRKDSSGSLVADGEYTVLQTDATGALKVTGGIPFEGGHVNYNVDGDFTGIEVGGLPLTVDENDTFQPFRSEAGNLKVTVEGGTGGNTSIELGTAATTTPATASGTDYVVPSDTDRLNLIIQNQSDTDPIYVSATATPGAGLLIKPEGSVSFSRSPGAEYHVSTAGPSVQIVWFAEVA